MSDQDGYYRLLESKWPEGEQPEFGPALDVSIQAVQDYPHSSRLWYLRGILLQFQIAYDKGLTLDETGELNKASLCLKRALKLDPCSWEAYESLGYLYYTWSYEYRKAEVCFKRSMEVGCSVESFLGLALALAEQGRDEEAIGILDRADHKFPRTARVGEVRREILAGL